MNSDIKYVKLVGNTNILEVNETFEEYDKKDVERAFTSYDEACDWCYQEMQKGDKLMREHYEGDKLMREHYEVEVRTRKAKSKEFIEKAAGRTFTTHEEMCEWCDQYNAKGMVKDAETWALSNHVVKEPLYLPDDEPMETR